MECITISISTGGQSGRVHCPHGDEGTLVQYESSIVPNKTQELTNTLETVRDRL